MQRTFTLDPGRLESFEIGSLLLAILAFPGADEEVALKEAAEALCARQLRTTIAVDRRRMRDWKAAFPDYAAIDEPERRRRLRTFQRRLRHRMLASKMSLAFFEEGITKRPAKRPSWMKRLSINELSKLILPESHQGHSENLERRVWHDSRPVIHLAAATQIAMRVMVPDTKEVGYPLDNGRLHAAVIQLAEFHEEIVLADPRFGKAREELIRVRLAS